MLAAAIQAFRELFTPPFRAVLFKCVGLTIGLLVLLIVLIEGIFNYTVAWPDWIETTISWIGGLGLVIGSIFLIPPVTSLMAGLYLDDIAGQVERVHYPADPPGKEMPAIAAIGVGLKFFFVVLVGEPGRSVAAARAWREPDRLLCRQRLSVGAGIFRDGGHAASAG